MAAKSPSPAPPVVPAVGVLPQSPVPVAAPKPAPLPQFKKLCETEMQPDGTLLIQFSVRADMASRIVRRAGTRPLDDYVYDHLLKQFESVCY